MQREKNWRPLSFSQIGEIPASGIVFAGYGIETPDEDLGRRWEEDRDLQQLRASGCEGTVVLAFRYLPEGITPERRNELIRYSGLRYKALTARQKGARGLIVVSGPNSKVVDQLAPLAFDASLASSGIAAISITDAVGDELLASAGKTLKELQDKLDNGDLMGGIECSGLTLSAKIDIEQEKKRTAMCWASFQLAKNQIHTSRPSSSARM